jgi:hypothetical protein
LFRGESRGSERDGLSAKVTQPGRARIDVYREEREGQFRDDGMDLAFWVYGSASHISVTIPVNQTVLTFLRQFLCMVAVSHRLAFSFLHPGW